MGVSQRFRGIHDGKTVVETWGDTDQAVKAARLARDGAPQMFNTGDAKLAYRLPVIMLHIWLKESGLHWGSKEFDQYIERKMASGEFEAFKA